MECGLERLLRIEPYALNKYEKHEMLTEYLNLLTQRHDASCIFPSVILQGIS